MKRYAVFSFDTYYPGGGWNDFEASFDTIEEARAHQFKYSYRPDNVQIVDLQTGEVLKDLYTGEVSKEV